METAIRCWRFWTLYFVSWNRAAGGWNSPKTVDTVGSVVTGDNLKQVSIAAGPSVFVRRRRLLFACGLRPQELLALRDDDVQPGALRIDEAIKEREKGDKRLGETKSSESKGYVYLPDAIYREIQRWQMMRDGTVPYHSSVQAASGVQSPFLFPTERGTPFHIGNLLKGNLKPLALKAGIPDSPNKRHGVRAGHTSSGTAQRKAPRRICGIRSWP